MNDDSITVRVHPSLLKDMREFSAAIDEAVGTSDYAARCVALALLARQFMRDVDRRAVPDVESR